jgi:hypothetical protein
MNHSPNFRDLTGKIFGKLTVVEFSRIEQERERERAIWVCQCSCGRKIDVRGYNLESGNTRSCGCSRIMFPSRLRHGFSRKGNRRPVYHSWQAMKSRCTNPKLKQYKDYGGRGITYCKRWETFENFRDDMFPTWKPGLTLDRIDNEKGYEKSNCRWATRYQQIHNRRTLQRKS